MMFNSFKSAFELVINPVLLKYLVFLLSYVLGVFFFWRVAKRELVESQVIFDLVVFASLVALAFGRLADFFLRPEFYQFSIEKLIFFNIFPGLDFIGSFLGIVLAVFIYSKTKKNNFWYIFDFIAIGISFSLAIFNTFIFLIDKYVSKSSELALSSGIYSLLFWILFWFVKRLEKKKRHKGFFAYFFFSCFFAITLLGIFFAKHTLLYKQFLAVGVGALLVITICFWYLAAKRKIRNDLKEIFAFIVLVFMKALRVLTNIREADNLSKSIVLSPLHISKLVVILVKYIGHELTGTLVDVARGFGFRK